MIVEPKPMTLERLEKLVKDLDMTQSAAMDELQTHHIIADECCWLHDIADADLQAAFDHLLEFYLF